MEIREMKKKIVVLSIDDDIPEDAVFIGQETQVTGYKFLVPDRDVPQVDRFVGVHDAAFNLAGETLRFAGTNAYYLPTFENHDVEFCNRTWELFTAAGINLVRTWGFYDGKPQFDGDPSFQHFENGEPVFNEQGLQCLDRTVAKAAERDIHLIIALTNYHEELGGYKEYCKAVDAPETFGEFMDSIEAQGLFKQYITMLLHRVNTVTGRKYKDEPAIMAWDICNEARNPEQDPVRIRDWYQEIAQLIKSIDQNHMVATGEDGFEHATTGSYGSDGKIKNARYTVADYSNTYVIRADEGTSYLLNTAIPEIDFGGFHWYPSAFGFGPDVNPEIVLAQEAWLKDHASIASSFSKPVILGEYGFHVNWVPSEQIYSHLWIWIENVLDGALIWELVTNGPKHNESGGNISPTRGPYELFLSHIDTMVEN